MIKNPVSAPIKDGVLSDNFTWSSNKISGSINGVVESLPSLLIDDENISDSTTFSSAKIETFFAPAPDDNEGE